MKKIIKQTKKNNLSSLGEGTQSAHTDFNLFLGPEHTMLEKFENAALFLLLGQLSTLISYLKKAFEDSI